MSYPFLKGAPDEELPPPHMVLFYEHARNTVGRSAADLRTHRLAKRLTREEFCTLLAYACIRTAALVAVGGGIPADAFDGVLEAECDKIEAKWAQKQGKQQ